jgi:hypothetical protein
MSYLTGPAPHIGKKEVKRILKLDLSRADADVVLRGLMGAEAELGPTEEFRGQMRELELVGKAAGLITFKGVIGLMKKGAKWRWNPVAAEEAAAGGSTK